MQYYIGCSGWSYTSWKGPFYPSNLENAKWLNYYSQIFDYVEIDSSFYRTPSVFMAKNWSKRTPENFRFTAKFPKVITHDKRLKNVDRELELFFQVIDPLKSKTLALLIQLPPSLTISQGLEGLRQLLRTLDNTGFRYAVEVRHNSWFQDLAYNFFTDNNICMVWSQLANIRTPPIVTTDFLYIRFIGDRSIQERDFGSIQKDRISEMRKWARNLNAVLKQETRAEEEGEAIMGRGRKNNINLAIVAANNHYAGFGPGTANLFRSVVGLPQASWGKNKQNLIRERDLKQSTLSDFID